MTMRTHLWLVLAVLASTPRFGEGQTVEEDHCNIIDEYGEIYSCNGGQYELRGELYTYVSISCEAGVQLKCSTFPRITYSNRSSLREVKIWTCAYGESVACLLRKMDVADTESLSLNQFRSPVTKKLMEGLKALRDFSVYNRGGPQISIEPDVISSIPNLTTLWLLGVRMNLKSQFQVPLLTNLKLEEVVFDQLPPGAFEGMPSLTELSLKNSKITTLHNDTFRGLSKLRRFVLIDNSFSSWSPEVLAPLQNLEDLRISINHVADGMFHGFPKLQNIKITSSESLQLDVKAFGNLKSLRNLDLGDCHINHLYSTVFHGTILSKLSLTKNQLEMLHPDLFRGQAELAKLDLSRNRLTKIAAALFTPLKKLVELDISYNNIEIFEDFVFSPLQSLKILRATRNNLKQIQELAFQIIPLRTLDLSKNRVSCYSDPFGGLTELTDLNLKDNDVDTVCSSWTLNLTKLERLNLAGNKFTALKATDLFYNSRNLKVDLRSNRIKSIYVDRNLLLKPVFMLDHNPFSCDCDMYYFMDIANSSAYLRNFKIHEIECASPVSLKGIRVTKVPRESFECDEENCPSDCKCIFKPAKDIVHAQCSALANQRSNLSKAVSLKLIHAPKSLNHLPFDKVTEIDLSGLSLNEVPYDKIPKTIKFMDLSNNNLEYFPSQLFGGDIKFALGNNSFDCDCKNYEHITNMLQNVPKIVDFERVTCENGTLLSDAKRLCETGSSGPLYIGVSLTLFGVFCIIIAAIAYKYSFELKICIAKYLPCLLPEEKYDASKKYDVFVSFAHQDEDFVCDEILKRLEGPPNYLKACLHTRDWIAGETIPYNIVKSVVESRRTLIVLSGSFLSSIWAMMEFRVAHVQATKEGRARVIILLLEDVINRDELDQELRAYLHTNTYIKWGEPWFWDKLFYVLPRGSRLVDRREEERIQAVADEVIVIKERHATQQGETDPSS